MVHPARDTQISRKRAFRMGVSVVALGAIAVGAAAPVVLAPLPAYAHEARELLAAFAGDKVLTATELDKERGGFYMPNGALVNFGMEIKHMVDGLVTNDIQVNQVQNHFTMTTNGGPPVEVTQLPANGFNVTTVANGGETKLVTNVNNGGIQTLVQNSANNQSVQTVTTVNVSTQGFQNAVQHVTTNFQIMNTIHMNTWNHR